MATPFDARRNSLFKWRQTGLRLCVKMCQLKETNQNTTLPISVAGHVKISPSLSFSVSLNLATRPTVEIFPVFSSYSNSLITNPRLTSRAFKSSAELFRFQIITSDSIRVRIGWKKRKKKIVKSRDLIRLKKEYEYQ